MTLIRKIPSHIIDQIAAGEVIAGPASALKELLDNALDAGAHHIQIHFEEAGHTLLQVTDDGGGIVFGDMKTALLRHATSKLPEDRLDCIETLGFRGEALAAMASIADLTLISRTEDTDIAFRQKPEFPGPQPCKGAIGTTVVLKNIFERTPARLKFLKSARSTRLNLRTLLTRYALAFPHVSFTAVEGDKDFFSASAENTPNDTFKDVLLARIADLFPEIETSELKWLDQPGEDGYRVCGYLAPPSLHQATTSLQYITVNGRPLKDPLVTWSLKAAFSDVIPHGRHPFAVLHLTVPPGRIDMNVHPAKEEVRFAQPQMLKKWLSETLKTLLRQPWANASPAFFAPDLSIEANKPQTPKEPAFQEFTAPKQAGTFGEARDSGRLAYSVPPPQSFDTATAHALDEEPQAQNESKTVPAPLPDMQQPLGQALGQINNRYIVAANAEGLVLVDQHAAHERLNYEDMKKTLDARTPESLLVPLFITLPAAWAQAITPFLAPLKNAGLHLESQGGNAFMLYSIPPLLNKEAAEGLVKDLAEALAEDKTTSAEDAEGFVKIYLLKALGNHACKNSIKAGDRLSVQAMNAMLRAMEAAPHSGQCNHGRPTSIKLTQADLDKLFQRR